MLKIAGIQFACDEDEKRNMDNALNLAALAAEEGAKIICFQQLFYWPWFPREINDEHFRLAQGRPRKQLAPFFELARREKVVLICPVFEKGTRDKYYNSALVIGEEGRLLGRYRKIHVPDLPLWKERHYFTPGNSGFPVFDTPYGRIAVQLCWDTFFPEGFRILALKGAQIVFCPTAAAHATQKRWQRVLAGHAMVNNLFVMRVNRVGKEAKQTFYGNSFCVDPHGDVLGETGEGTQSILLCDVNLQEIDKLRRNWTCFDDRRPECYRELNRRQE